MKTEPDLDGPEGVESLLYISQERVREITRAAAGGPEFLIQIVIDDRERTLTGLTNYGRLFYTSEDSETWHELETPNLEIEP